MNTCRTILVVLILLATSLSGASDEKGEIFVADLERPDSFDLSLEGADYYFWLTPENGRVVLNKQCVPVEKDCDHNVLAVWDENGEKIFERAPIYDITDMSGGRIFATTLAGTNRLFLSTVVRTDTYSGILAEYDIEKLAVVHRFSIDPIRCRRLRADDEGTIWCLGVDLEKRREDLDYDLVYRFDDSGVILKSSLPRSTYAENPKSLANLACCREDYFLNGGDHMHLWLSGPNELIRFEPDGILKDRLVLPTLEGQVGELLAMAPDGSVFAMLITATNAKDHDTWTQALYRLAPDGGSWIPLQDPPVQLPMRIELKAADERGLILLDRESLQLLWYPYDKFVASN